MQAGVVAPGRAVGDDVARHGGQTADDGALPHAAVLVHGAQAAQENLVADLSVTAQSGVVGHDDIVADHTVVTHVGAGHEQTVRSNARYARALRRAPVEAGVFTDDVVRADLQPHRLALVAIVLRVAADDGEGMDDRPRADARVLLDHDMADQLDALGQGHARADDAPGADHDPVGDLGRGVDDGGRVDGHWAGSATVTTMAMNSASAASLPSMKVSPRNL
ncbi:hypothetical protein D3C80_1475770 [compost metagenome]